MGRCYKEVDKIAKKLFKRKNVTLNIAKKASIRKWKILLTGLEDMQDAVSHSCGLCVYTDNKTEDHMSKERNLCPIKKKYCNMCDYSNSTRCLVRKIEDDLISAILYTRDLIRGIKETEEKKK